MQKTSDDERRGSKALVKCLRHGYASSRQCPSLTHRKFSGEYQKLLVAVLDHPESEEDASLERLLGSDWSELISQVEHWVHHRRYLSSI